MSEGDDASGAAAPKPHAEVRVPCLHNPASHEIAFHLANQDFVWADLEGTTDDDLDEVAKHIKLHPLTLSDAKTFGQHPKIEDYDDYVFMVVAGVDPDTASGDPLLREVHIIITSEIVVTIHRRRNHALDELRARYDQQPVRSRIFLVYSVLDAVVSTFVPVLDRIDDDIDDIEEKVIGGPQEAQLGQIFSLKRDLVAMRRVITPMRDMFLRRADHVMNLPGMQTDDTYYFRDLYDSLIRSSELVDSYRDLLSGTTDLYLSTVANRQGEVNRQLTIVATVFLPLSFLTGFFGQNFALLTNHVINADWTFWAFGVGLEVAAAVGFWVYFVRKGWVGGDATGGAAQPSAPSSSARKRRRPRAHGDTHQ